MKAKVPYPPAPAAQRRRRRPPLVPDSAAVARDPAGHQLLPSGSQSPGSAPCSMAPGTARYGPGSSRPPACSPSCRSAGAAARREPGAGRIGVRGGPGDGLALGPGLAAGGVAGPVPARKGPRRASKLTGEMVRGSPDWTRRARACTRTPPRPGCSRSACATRWAGYRPEPPGRGAAGEDAAGDDDDAGRAAAGESAPGEHDRAGAGQREPLPVLPDPVPRGGERAASRWGPLGEGAEPVFRRSARFRDFTTTRPWPRSPATLTG